jgi:hypothetical protein
MKGLHEVMLELLSLLAPFGIVVILGSISTDYFLGSGSVDSFLNSLFQKLQLENHSFSLVCFPCTLFLYFHCIVRIIIALILFVLQMPKPWPSIYTLIIMNSLAFSGVWLWSLLCFVVLWLPTLLFRVKPAFKSIAGHSKDSKIGSDSSSGSPNGSHLPVNIITTIPLR